MLIEILVLFILILLNAFFAGSEIALISLNDNKVKKLADSGDKKAKLLYNLLSEPSRFLATIQIGITLAGFLASAFAAENFAGRLTSSLISFGVPIPQRLLGTISLIVITLLLSYFTLVFGELVPKRLALQKAEFISMLAIVPLTFLSKFSSPFVKLLTLSTNTIVKLFGLDPNSDDKSITEEEIRMMIEVSKAEGKIQETESFMINNVFEFDNKTVSDIFTHRTDIVAISIDTPLKEVVEFVSAQQYTRFPIYKGNTDNIIGVLHVKDLMPYLVNNNNDTFILTDIIREPYFVLESTKIDTVFKDMQKNNVHLAVAIDEYGGTDGIITIEDLIEEIVGNIFDEYDNPESEDEIHIVSDNTYLVSGTVNLYKIEDLLKIELPTEEYDTLSGFIIGQLGYIPRKDEKPNIEINNFNFKVEKMKHNRIQKVKIFIKKSPQQ